ncbi:MULTISPECIES: cysteine dioxygenase family protein [Kitasatospora]|uniref:cysteine dioxygenase family protein n=1 Tax=Kitasatospora TaxID=2063 RepID=UPI000C70A0D5|nr:cysteine dioxygenase family protein [Kitasatospora sp. GP30]MDH6143682.1 putative metal-dependent enzyme (double-stranded beta helix superfamily) [Kitasatospora sp. GP30]
MQNSTERGSNLDEFLSDLQRYAAAGVLTPQLTADTLRKYLRAGLIVPADLCAGDTDGYAQRVLHTARTYSVVALTWLPGQSTPIHDHIAWCVSGVLEGAEVDEAFRLWRLPHSGRKVLVPTGRTTCTAGRVQLLVPPDEDIHRVSNGGTGRAVSLHVYGADITLSGNSSINRVFGHEVVAGPPPGASLVSWRLGSGVVG